VLADPSSHRGSPGLAKVPHARYDSSMTGRAHKLLEDALTLPDDERLDLAEQLLSSLPSDSEWLAELERRARRALADPNGGEAWDVVERRLAARVASR
jgi:putative addiction module component (TIGR02574 family)